MPEQYVFIDTNKNFGAQLLNATAQLRPAIYKLDELKDAADNNVADPSYDALASMFGLPDVTDAAGQALYNRLAGAISELNADTSVNELMNIYGRQ